MFPQKIEFDGKTYRTNSYNKVLDLIYQQTNELRGVEKKRGCPKRVPSIFYAKVRTFPSSDFLICSKMFILEHVNR